MRTAELYIGFINNSVREHNSKYGLVGEQGLNLGHRIDRNLLLLCWSRELAKIPLENIRRSFQLEKSSTPLWINRGVLIRRGSQVEAELDQNEETLTLQYFQGLLEEHRTEYYPTRHFDAARFAREVERAARELAWMSSIKCKNGRYIEPAPKIVEAWGKSWQQHTHFAYHGSMDSRITVVRALDRSGVI